MKPKYRTQNNTFPECVLIPYFGSFEPLVGVEIGVASASGSLGMLIRLPQLKLWCVDSWAHTPGEQFEAGGWTEKDHADGYDLAVRKLEEFKNRVTILKMTSDEAVLQTPDELDFVYIDGHHTYEQCKKDIYNYSKKVKVDGLICGHDFGQVPDVTRAVVESFRFADIRVADDFVWWVVKQEETAK